jgi:KaiC/GvpD/RAD55 family RecA-like ATPase
MTDIVSKAKTGIDGLDDVLAGGFSVGRVFLLEGDLADTVVLLRYFEAHGQVRRAISVIKKRTGRHESTIREYRLSDRGLSLGEPLAKFQGVLRGVPSYVGGAPLLSAQGP